MGYIGVLRRKTGSFTAYVHAGGKIRRGGSYTTEIEAAVARDRLAKELVAAPWLQLNFPEGEPPGVELVRLRKGRPTLEDDDYTDEARLRRMVAKGDKVHGRRLLDEIRRRFAEAPDVHATGRRIRAAANLD